MFVGNDVAVKVGAWVGAIAEVFVGDMADVIVEGGGMSPVG
jgi:hypothetical protein